jgi:hypothetical protein
MIPDNAANATAQNRQRTADDTERHMKHTSGENTNVRAQNAMRKGGKIDRQRNEDV